jgi:hypothetical protein
VLVTLLVLWLVVVPTLTMAGTYVLSGILGRRMRARTEHLGSGGTGPTRLTPARAPHATVRARSHQRRSAGHVLTRH